MPNPVTTLESIEAIKPSIEFPVFVMVQEAVKFPESMPSSNSPKDQEKIAPDLTSKETSPGDQSPIDKVIEMLLAAEILGG